MTTTITPIRPAVQLGFAWSCRKAETSDNGTVHCAASGTDPEQYKAHMRGHGALALRQAKLPKLRGRPAVTLRKPLVMPATCELITWTARNYGSTYGDDGLEVLASCVRRGQFWADHPHRGHVWVIPAEPAPWENGPARPVALYQDSDGAWHGDARNGAPMGGFDERWAAEHAARMASWGVHVDLTEPEPEPEPEADTVTVWDVTTDESAEVARAEAAAGMVRYARSLGPGSPACGEYERTAMRLARGEDDTEMTTPVKSQAELLRERAKDIIAARDAARGPAAGEDESPRVIAPAPAYEGSQGAVALRQGSGVVRQERVRVDGAETLAYARKFLAHFAVWPSEAALTTATLWAAHCHARDAAKTLVFMSSPRLLFSSAEPGSGKSHAMKLVSRLCPDPVIFTEPSEPAMAHSIGDHATIGLEEVDVFFGTGNRKAAVRAIINDGYTPDGFWARVRNGVTHRMPTFGPLMMAGLDKVESGTSGVMAATLSRCIRIKMRRAPEDYRPPRFDHQARMAATLIGERLTAWCQQELAGMATYVPELPEGFGNRDAELFEPLAVIADIAGGEWPALMRDAAEELIETGGMPAEDEDKAAQLDEIMSGWGTGEDWTS